MEAILVRPNGPGGVRYYWSVLEPELESLESLYIGRHGAGSNYPTIIRLVFQYILFCFILATRRPSKVILNPSLNIRSILRDSVFLLISLGCLRGVTVFFRGWSTDFQNSLTGLKLWLLRGLFDRAESIIVLADQFKNQLLTWNFQTSITVETTTFDPTIVDGFDFRKVMNQRKKNPKKVLFLANVIEEKGIFDLMEAVETMNEAGESTELIICGKGNDLEKVKKKKEQSQLSQMFNIKGYVTGNEKKSMFEEASVYALPTFYDEGMPNSVVEAMAFGLPVVVTRLGGLSYHLTEDENCIFVPPKSPYDLCQSIERIFKDRALFETMSENNYRLARELFHPKVVGDRLRDIF